MAERSNLRYGDWERLRGRRIRFRSISYNILIEGVLEGLGDTCMVSPDGSSTVRPWRIVSADESNDIHPEDDKWDETTILD